MERRTVNVSLTVLTTRQRDREIDIDLCRLGHNLVGMESGETTIEEVNIKEII